MSGSVGFFEGLASMSAGICCLSLVAYIHRRVDLARFRKLIEADGNGAALSRLSRARRGIDGAVVQTRASTSHDRPGPGIRNTVQRCLRLVEKMFGDAGLLGRVTPEIVFGIEAGLALFGAISVSVLAGSFQWQTTLTGAALGTILPAAALRRLSARRRQQMQRQLPFALDILTLCAEAGLGLESGLTRVTQRLEGLLADEFRLVVHDIRTGKPRHEALRRLAERVNTPELYSLVATLIQAEQLGSSVVPVFRTLALQLRQRRAQHAEELAMKAPVKMLFPLVFCIFPALLIILFGPLLVSGFGGVVR